MKMPEQATSSFSIGWRLEFSSHSQLNSNHSTGILTIIEHGLPDTNQTHFPLPAWSPPFPVSSFTRHARCPTWSQARGAAITDTDINKIKQLPAPHTTTKISGTGHTKTPPHQALVVEAFGNRQSDSSHGRVAPGTALMRMCGSLCGTNCSNSPISVLPAPLPTPCSRFALCHTTGSKAPAAQKQHWLC